MIIRINDPWFGALHEKWGVPYFVLGEKSKPKRGCIIVQILDSLDHPARVWKRFEDAPMYEVGL